MRVVCIPKVILTEELEKRWDLICENAKECQTEGPLEYLQKDDRENWISEKKELKNQYMELCSSWSDMISYQHIDKVEYMCFGGMGNFCVEYDIYNTLNKIDDCKELCDWLLKVAKSESFSSGERDKPYYAELDGLFELNAEMAEDIVSKEKYLSLGGLSSLSDDVIEILSRHPGGLYLDGLVNLSSSAAKSLSKHKGELSLEGLLTLDNDAIENLSMHKGDIWLSGLTELSDASAESLSKQKGVLSLGLTKLSNASAESLSKHEGDLYLGGLKQISDEAAESLSKHEGNLFLFGLTELSDVAAKSLAKMDPDKIFLPEELEELVAKFR